MGKEFVVSSLEEMCALMCDNIVPEEEVQEDEERDIIDKTLGNTKKNK